MKTKIKSAEGVTGFLLFDGVKPFFRIYDKKDKGEFTDYTIAHNDLQITIVDSDAYLYEYNEDENFLDHSPSTLDRSPETLGKK